MFKDKQEEKFYREATNTFCNYSDPYASYSEHMWKAGCDYTKDKLIALGWTPPGNNQHNNAEIHIKNTVIQQCIDILVAASNRSRHNPNTKMALDSCARSIFMLGELDKDEDGELFLVQQAVQAEPVEQDPIYIVGSGWQCDAYPTLGTKLYTEAPAVAQGEPVAWANFAENGNIRVWTTVPSDMKKLADLNNCELVALYTHPAPAVANPPADVVRELVEALNRLISVAERCDGWESFPRSALEDASVALKSAKEHGL